MDVPVVDLTPYTAGGSESERRAVADAVDAACREVGFLQVLGHGVPDAAVAGLASAIDDFFALDDDAKRAWVRPGWENRGYTPPRSESLSLSLGVEQASRMNDFFEAYNVGRSAADYPAADLAGVAEHYAATTWPDVAGFDLRVSTWLEEASRVARTLTRVFADALGLAPTYFDDLTGHSIEVLRMNHYALPPGTEVALDGDLVGMGEHTDFGIVTVLWADDEKGLQVLGDDGRWHDVSPLPGALLVNLGDLTARLTNERWRSTLHRVKPPLVDGTVRRRRSAALFHDGDADAVVGPLASCVDAEHPPLYAPVTVDEHVRAKLAGSRAGVLNTAAEREGARVRAAVPAGEPRM
ncbi:MAG: 2OG-Fe(II) oxygenase [Nocardioides sp.]|nr:2OG-Fe(II) oxygenase [Nocardioides sp.]